MHWSPVPSPDGDAASSERPPVVPGYRLDEVLGRGAGGPVWRAWRVDALGGGRGGGRSHHRDDGLDGVLGVGHRDGGQAERLGEGPGQQVRGRAGGRRGGRRGRRRDDAPGRLSDQLAERLEARLSDAAGHRPGGGAGDRSAGRLGDPFGPVAVKIVPGGPAAAQELALLRRVRHPFLVPLLDAVVLEDGSLALVLELVAGGSLRSLVAARGALTAGEVVTVLSPMARTLADLHARGIQHGDVAPGNVLLDRSGRPLLADLGTVRITGTGRDEVFGTAGYVDPVVLAGGCGTPASDVYGLGAVGWFALAGEPPPAAPLRPRLSELVPAAPTALLEAVEAAVDPDPARRLEPLDLARALHAACRPAPLWRWRAGPDDGGLTRRVLADRAGPARRVDDWTDGDADDIGAGAGPVEVRPRHRADPPLPARLARRLLAPGLPVAGCLLLAAALVVGLWSAAGPVRTWASGLNRSPGTGSGAAGGPPAGPDRAAAPPAPAGTEEVQPGVSAAASGARKPPAAAASTSAPVPGSSPGPSTAGRSSADPPPGAAPSAGGPTGAAPSAGGPTAAAPSAGAPTPGPSLPRPTTPDHLFPRAMPDEASGVPWSGPGRARDGPHGDLAEAGTARAVVRELAARRAAELGEPRLRGASATAPGSAAARADAAARRTLLRMGLTYRHLLLSVREVTVLGATRNQALVRATTDVSAYEVVDATGRVRYRVPPRRGPPALLHLVRTAQGWRVRAVTAP